MSGAKNSSKVLILITIAVLVIVVGALWHAKSNQHEFLAPLIPNNSQSIQILIVGDMMLDRNVRNTIDKKGFDYFFGGVKEVVKDADISVVNLEGPFTPYASLTSNLKNKTLQFTFDPSLASALADLGFDVLGLANNHTMNFGSGGFEMTKRYIGSSGMLYYGDPNNATELSTVIAKNGIKVGFVGFHEFTYFNFDKVFAEIARLQPEVDVLIVSPHWGVEYQKEPTDLQQKWAHQFIDLGADAVIGAHSHVVGEIEEYQGKKIFYSLGNFAFDQYFSEKTMNGLGVVIDIEKDENKINLNYRTVPIRTDREGTRVSTTTFP